MNQQMVTGLGLCEAGTWWWDHLLKVVYLVVHKEQTEGEGWDQE